ncbi:SpoIID/LytB domain-containing protein [Nocardia pneumoniae]|uniref:SpoIID/LytB domain-containing protein n=1 Tax=Nocardia pneumoniae TaxID=228601 RepID=UPI0009FD3B49|nr:SpoIID/LytB domain-containing protein [Nocardia pneumoniae]
MVGPIRGAEPRAVRGRRGSTPRPVSVGTAALLTGAVFVLSGWPGDAPYRTVAGPGHGRGMSQVGAFESARGGWVAERILTHYYPGAVLAAVAPTAVRVRLMALDGSSLDAFAAAGLRVAGRDVAPGHVAHLTPLPGGGANVVVTVGCDGEVLWQAATDDQWIHPLDPRPNRPVAEHLTLCGGPAYRGALGVTVEDGAPRTVNQVDVEDYLLGVVPAEVQANWADKGAAEALRAQAIAARSYALAERRYPYAQTCDTTDCQEYPGTAREDPRAAAAVAATAGTVLLRDGRILRTEYSAAPDGGTPADIYTFDVGPAPHELLATAPPEDPHEQTPGTESAIEAEYRRIGGATSAVGTPIGPEMILPQHAGTYRLFTNGVIIATPTLGAQVVDFTTLLQLVPDSPEGKAIPPTAGTPSAEAAHPSGGAPPAASVAPAAGAPHAAGGPRADVAPPSDAAAASGAVPPPGTVPPSGPAVASDAAPPFDAAALSDVVPGADGAASVGGAHTSTVASPPAASVPSANTVPRADSTPNTGAVPPGDTASASSVPPGGTVPAGSVPSVALPTAE